MQISEISEPVFVKSVLNVLFTFASGNYLLIVDNFSTSSAIIDQMKNWVEIHGCPKECDHCPD
jgi:hypothetical protein